MLQFLACRHGVTAALANVEITREILVIGTQPVALDTLLSSLAVLACRPSGGIPYVILPDGLQELAARYQLPYVTYGSGPRAHVRSQGGRLTCPLGTAALPEGCDDEALAVIAAALVARMDLTEIVDLVRLELEPARAYRAPRHGFHRGPFAATRAGRPRRSGIPAS